LSGNPPGVEVRSAPALFRDKDVPEEGFPKSSNVNSGDRCSHIIIYQQNKMCNTVDSCGGRWKEWPQVFFNFAFLELHFTVPVFTSLYRYRKNDNGTDNIAAAMFNFLYNRGFQYIHKSDLYSTSIKAA
jgi:hypothetical protein